MMFAKSGGRLFRIAALFVVFAFVAILIMTYFTHRAMNEVKELLLAGKDLPGFYTQLIDNMKIGTVLTSLSGVLIAIAARYGLRESTKNIGEGMKNVPSNDSIQSNMEGK